MYYAPIILTTTEGLFVTESDHVKQVESKRKRVRRLRQLITSTVRGNNLSKKL